jgi:MFS superfamily sulfate permease-like transporter
MKMTTPFLVATLLLTGFYAGIGFFGFMGANPALTKMSSSTFAEYWQHIDSYMAARMKIFGPLLLLCVLTTVLLHLRSWHSPAFWSLVAALLFLIVDLIIAFSINVPLNRLIQSWDLANLPDNVQDVKQRVVTAFYYRNGCMIGCFVSALISLLFTNRSTGNI